MFKQGPNIDLIFVAITREKGKIKLKNALKEKLSINPNFKNNLYLLRESASLPGAITLDTLEYNHKENKYFYVNSHRFAYIQNLQDGFGAGIMGLFTDKHSPEYNWCIIPDEERQLHIDNQNYIFINKQQLSSNQNKIQFFDRLIQILEDMGVNFDNIVHPTRQESSRDLGYPDFGEYYSYKLSKNRHASQSMVDRAQAALEKMEINELPVCPITLSQISDEGYITPQGQMYSSAILTWIDEHQSDPLTRGPLTREQLLVTQAALKFEEAKKRLKDILSQFNGESSESRSASGSSMRM